LDAGHSWRVAYGAHRLGRVKRIPPELISLFSQVVRLIGLVVAVVTALGTVGVNVSAAVAGLGLTGFGLSLALKDLLSNLLSGAMILMYRPFHVGDRIAVQAHEGVVSQINLRYTVLRGETARVMIPNSLILTEVVRVPARQGLTAGREEQPRAQPLPV
jgi:small conductance mechanosensitive channel